MTYDSQISQVSPGSAFHLRSSSLPVRGKGVLSAFFFFLKLLLCKMLLPRLALTHDAPIISF